MLQSIECRGLKTSFIKKGQLSKNKPIQFFIHGFPDTPDVWTNQIEYFSKNNLVIAPFLRGLPESPIEKSNERCSRESVGLDHLEILNSVDPEKKQKIQIIAHDIGGPHAWHLARLLGNRLHSLVILNAPELSQMFERINNPAQVLKSWYIAFFQLPVLPELFFKKYGPKALKTNRSFETITPLIHHYRQMAKEVFSLKKARLAKETPVLVLWGNKDPFLLPPTEEELKKLAENFSIRILDGGHWLAAEIPSKINSLIESFLETGK